jgi:hypothetical protein
MDRRKDVDVLPTVYGLTSVKQAVNPRRPRHVFILPDYPHSARIRARQTNDNGGC